MLAVVVILSFFAIMTIWSPSRSRETARAPQTAASDTPLNAQTPSAQAAGQHAENTPLDVSSKFVLGEFHRSEVRDGKKVWEIKASQGKYHPEKGSALLNEARLWMFKKDGSSIELFSHNAEIFFQGAELSRADVSSDVKLIYNNDVTVETDEAHYVKADDTVLAPNKVVIKSNNTEVRGEDMRVQVEEQIITLSRNVETFINPVKTAEDHR